MLDHAGGDIGYRAAECVQSGTQAPTRTIAGPKIPCHINLIAAVRLAPLITKRQEYPPLAVNLSCWSCIEPELGFCVPERGVLDGNSTPGYLS
jgi:hypothetical protein